MFKETFSGLCGFGGIKKGYVIIITREAREKKLKSLKGEEDGPAWLSDAWIRNF